MLHPGLHRRRFLLVFLAGLAGAPSAWGAEPPVNFERDLAPLLRTHCLKCHSGAKPKGGLDLTQRESMLQGGLRGAAVTPNKASESLLFEYVRDKKMPPNRPLDNAQIETLRRWIDAGAVWEGPRLRPPEMKRAGLDWWSLQPLRRPAVPKAARAEWVRNPIDAFILAQLDAKQLAPAPEADRSTYIRRVTFDLTGLPPTPEETAAFVNDKAADAYEKLVDRLLASPAYGERWGRHWLDVVRFGESHGYEMNTLRPNAWPYRDYVIQAFNEDRPFPRFVREQLAGDVAAKDDPLGNVATGFLVAGAHDLVGNAVPEAKVQMRHDDLADMVSTTATAFLGLTVGCARCHDHKFDPITQKDFYSLEAVFAGVDHAERPMHLVPEDQRRRESAALRTKLLDLERQIDEQTPLAAGEGTAHVRPVVQTQRNVERFESVAARFVRFTITATNNRTEPCLDELEIYGPDAAAGNLALASKDARATASSVLPNVAIHQIAHLNDGKHGNSHSWISNEAGAGWAQIELPQENKIDRVVWGRDREGKFTDRIPTTYRVDVSSDGKEWKAVAGSWDRLTKGETPGPKAWKPGKELQTLLVEQKAVQGKLLDLERPATAYAGTFRTPDKTHVLERGDPSKPGDEIGPGAVAAVKPAFTLKSEAPEPERRLALADWIADKNNPLPARVLVNRVWHWHLGQGIVRTPSDFGFNGDRPAHPELLDWLAAEYQANGWRLKPLHRLIVLSNTYRQSSRFDDSAARLDADNRLLWRYARHRLEAEEVRDSMLQVSGALNPLRGGPGYHLWDYSGYVIVFTPKKTLGPDEFRRMVYQFKPRLQQDSVFGAFDCPDATATAPRRNVSTTSIQALNLLNDPFVLDQSERFAARLRKDAGNEVAAQVRRAFQLAFNREPTDKESAAAVELVNKHGLAVLCRALFNANEFVFVN